MNFNTWCTHTIHVSTWFHRNWSNLTWKVYENQPKGIIVIISNMVIYGSAHYNVVSARVLHKRMFSLTIFQVSCQWVQACAYISNTCINKGRNTTTIYAQALTCKLSHWVTCSPFSCAALVSLRTLFWKQSCWFSHLFLLFQTSVVVITLLNFIGWW